MPPLLYHLFTGLFFLLPSSGGRIPVSLSEDVRLTGRFLLEEAVAHFDHPGTEIAFTTTAGCSAAFIGLSQRVDPTYGEPNYFEVFVDGRRVVSEEGALHSFSTESFTSSRVETVKLADLDPSRSHFISVFKGTEPQWNEIAVRPNYVTFHGLTLEGDDACGLGTPQPAPSRRLEFIGDSITCGYCNLCSKEQQEAAPPEDGLEWLRHLRRGSPRGSSLQLGDNGAELESHWDSWAPRLARSLDAEFHTAAWSGYGLVHNCCGGNTTMPMIYRRTLATVPESHWNMSQWVPDGVVINLGTNDGQVATTSAFTDAYVDLCTNITGAYGPQVELFLACGPMSTEYCDAVAETISRLTEQGLRAHFLDQRNAAADQCCGHPSVEDDTAMAEQGAAMIAAVMGW